MQPTTTALEDVRTERLKQLLEVCKNLSAQKELDALLELVILETSRILECDRCSLFLLDPRSNELYSKVALGVEGREIRFSADAGLAGQVVRTGQVMNVADAYAEPNFNRAIDEMTGYRTRSILTAPIKDSRGRVVGILQALNKREGNFTPHDEEVLLSLNMHAGVSIENSQFFEELSRERELLSEENVTLREQLMAHHWGREIIGTSASIRQVLSIVERISDTPVSIVITGESGTGKDFIAKMIHSMSSRRSKSYVAINCAAVPEGLLESELFGIERGVATGVERRVGRLEQAHGGTLFMDEIADMPLPMQAKLLRVLQEREFTRIGGTKTIRVDIRVLAATNRDLHAAIRAGTFREDLYYRLNVISLYMPPLRERREDILPLADHFLKKASLSMGREIRSFTPEAMQVLEGALWPGNVRQLENEVYRAVALSEAGKAIAAAAFSEEVRVRTQRPGIDLPTTGKMREAVAVLERQMIAKALAETRGNKVKAARKLGVSREGLRKKLIRYGMQT